MKYITTVPPYGLTLQAPWTALIAWGAKRIENRGKGVASTIGNYRGPVALTASASHTIGRRSMPFWRRGQPNLEVFEDMQATLDDLGVMAGMSTRTGQAITLRKIAGLAGCWFATAEIVGMREPTQDATGWHAPGQYGIVLANVLVLEVPEPATGGLGFYRFARCGTCQRPSSYGSRHRCVLRGQEPC